MVALRLNEPTSETTGAPFGAPAGGRLPLQGYSMGQAKNRGTREGRIADAIKNGRQQLRLHAFINETRMEAVLLKSFPCADCGVSVFPDETRAQVLDLPVRHGVQFGDCGSCGASHMIVSASNKADCVALEPVFAEMKRSFGLVRPS